MARSSVVDLSGKRFGLLVVLRREANRNGENRWSVKCDCGSEKTVYGVCLRNGNTRSCGCALRVDLTGQRFGRLLVRGLARRTGKAVLWDCLCDCGEVREAATAPLRYGKVQSCGCLGREIGRGNARHGLYSTANPHRLRSVHRAWKAMKQRCYDRSQASFKYYGGRGITVCERWRLSFDAFIADMGEPPPETSLDRIDPNGHYEPGNCRWATKVEQAANKRLGVPRVTEVLDRLANESTTAVERALLDRLRRELLGA